MLSGLLGTKRWPIALDIGTESVKMLQMHQAGGGIAVRSSAQWRLPATGPHEGDAWRKLVVGAVLDMLRTGGFRGRRVVSCLSCGQLKIKNVRLPSMSPAELAEALHWEAKERFGCDFAPDQLHYLLAGQVRQGVESYQEIILLAAPGEVVEERLSMLHEMGLQPDRIEPEPTAMFRPFERRLRRRADEDCITVVVDLGHLSSKVVVARGRDIVLVKTISVGGRKLSEAVARQLHLSDEEAGDLRIQIMREQTVASEAGPDSRPDPNSMSWTIVDALRTEVEELAREIALCLRYCSVTFRGLRPKEITITGGQAYDAAVIRLLGEHLGVSCQVGQPLKGVDISAADLGTDRRGMLTEWNVCAGLAFHYAETSRRSRKEDHERDRLSA